MVAVAMVLHVKGEAFTAIWVYTAKAGGGDGAGAGAGAKNVNFRTLGNKNKPFK